MDGALAQALNRNRMRVLHCIPSMEGGGAERQLTYLARGLREIGCDVHVALQRGGPNLSALRDAGATIHELGLRGNHDVRLLHRLLRVISAVQPDVIQCWLTQIQVVGGVAAVMARRPWVFSERSSGIAYPPGVKNALRVRIGALASAIVSNSASGDQYWAPRARRGVRRYIIPNGLPLDDIAAVSPATSRELDLAPREAFVLFAGRLDEKKNAATFVRALSRVRFAAPFRAMICGQGPQSGEIARLITNLGLEGRVELTGYTPDLWRLMKRANILVSTSRCEGNPNVVLEAMACGCPLIVSDIPAHLEFLDERSALIVPVDDVDGVATSMASVIERPHEAAARARAAVTLSARHSIHGMAQQYARVYDDAVSQVERPKSAVA
jgi:glycosyltransferase involved in cell wall biosynthesis